jgi:hypothetical protein
MNTVKLSLIAFALPLAVASIFLVSAKEPGEKKAPRPKEDPKQKFAVGDIEKLVKELGSDDEDRREAASVSLLKIGKDVLPRLKKAMADANPKLAARAELLFMEIGETWRYEVEAVIPPSSNLAIYRVRAWAPPRRNLVLTIGEVAKSSPMKPRAGSELPMVEFVVIAELKQLVDNPKRQTFRRQYMFGGRVGGFIFEDRVPSDKAIKDLVSIKVGSGIIDHSEEQEIGEVNGQPFSIHLGEKIKPTEPAAVFPRDRKAEKRFHQRLAELAKEKGEAPVDLLMELLLENRQYVGEEQWKQAIEIIGAIVDKVYKANKSTNRFFESIFDLEAFSESENLIGRDLRLSRPQSFDHRVIADRLTATNLQSSLVVCQNLEFADKKFPIVNGGGTVLLMKSAGAIRFGQLDGMLIYCDGDVRCEFSPITMVIARGKVTVDLGSGPKYPTPFFIENAGHASAVMLFSLDRVGMKVVQREKALYVESVSKNSPADTSGFKQGDTIDIVAKTTDPLSDLECIVRAAYVREINLELNVIREGRRQQIVFCFAGK